MKGTFAIENVRGFDPFKIEWDDLTSDVIQIDVSGRGILRENQGENEKRLREMWMIYDELTLHSSSLIGIDFEIKPGSLVKRKTRTVQAIEDGNIHLHIILAKPFQDKSSMFFPTMELVVTNILDCIFVITTC